jgi:cell division protein FtsQ
MTRMLASGIILCYNPTVMRKKILFWTAFVLAVVVATYLAVRITMLCLGGGAATPVRGLSISSENGRIDRTAIAAAVGIPANTPTYAVRLEDMLARILAIPDIEAASVRRLGSGSLQIRIRIRTAVAAWTDGNDYYPLAADGSVIKRPLGARPENSLVFRGILPDDLGVIVRALRAAPRLMARTEYVEWADGRRWDLITNLGVIVQLPENNAESAVLAASELDGKTNLLGRRISVLDMRDPERTFVKIK